MKKTCCVSFFTFSLFIFTFSLLFSGCRREDIREMTVTMPGLKESDRAIVEDALKGYRGVDKRSYQWDMEKKTLWLKYDSMKIAQSNIRYAIDEKGVKVKFPEKETDRAGY